METVTQETAVVKADRSNEQFALIPRSLQEAKEYGAMIANSSFAPKAYRGRPEDVVLAIQMGLELGLKPMQSVQSIAVINGVPSAWGQGLLGLIQSSEVCDYIMLTYDPVTKSAVCRCKRVRDPEEQTFQFSWEDAVRAQLDRKETYKQYPQNMLRWRALSLAAKFVFADVTKGLVVREEAMDYPPQEGAGGGAVRLQRKIDEVREARVVEEEPSVTDVEEADFEEVVEPEVEQPATDLFDAAPDEPSKTGSFETDPIVSGLTSLGLRSTASMDRFVGMVLGDPLAIAIDLTDPQKRKIAKATKLVEQVVGDEAEAFIRFCRENELPMSKAQAIIKAAELFHGSESTDDE